jgi:hypothetical protein
MGAYALRVLDETYREVTDLVTYGCAHTRFDLLKELIERGEKMGVKEVPGHKAYIEKMLDEYLVAVPLMLKSFNKEAPDLRDCTTKYAKAAKLRDALLHDHDPPEDVKERMARFNNTRVPDEYRAPLRHLAGEIENGWVRAQPLLRIRQDILMDAAVKKRGLSSKEWEIVRECTAGIQPLTHGLNLMARDVPFAQAMQNWNKAKRPMANSPAPPPDPGTLAAA